MVELDRIMFMNNQNIAFASGTPILPDGSFVEQSSIGENVSQILSLIPDD